jgi:hypothetical protein
MAIKTFTTGEVLTAADTNTYLANSGLVYIKSQTVGSGVGSVTVSDAFSATYDNYLIILNGGTMSSDTNMKMTLGSSATGYYGFMAYGSYTSGTVNGANDNNSTSGWTWGGGGSTNSAYVELIDVFPARETQMRSRVRYSNVYGNYVGHHGVSSSFTGFTFTSSSGTMTGGTITVYGYRKA